MNDNELKQNLKNLQVPKPNPERLEQNLLKAQYAFLHSKDELGSEGGLDLFSWRTGGIGICALFILLVFVMPFSASRNTAHNNLVVSLTKEDLTDARVLLFEMENLFPFELQAVMINGGSPKLILGGNQGNPKTHPVLLEIDGKEKLKILTYVGETLSLPLGEKIHKLEVLISGRGEILLIGDDFVGAGDKAARLPGYTLSAHSLERI